VAIATFLKGGARWPFVYGAALVCVGLVILAFQQWPPLSPLAWPLLVLLLPVIASASIGGPTVALFASAVAATAAVWFVLPPAGTFKTLSRLDSAALIVFGVASALIALVSQARHRAAVAQTRAAELSTAIAAEARRRRTLGDVTARTLAAGSTESVCRDSASLAALALECDHALVLELANEGAPFTVVAAVGWGAEAVQGLTIYTGVDTQAGYAVYAREPVGVGDGESEARFAIPAVLRGHGIRSGLAARIGTAVRPFGVLAVYSTSPRRFIEEDRQLLASIAQALGGLYERNRLEGERAELAGRDVAHRAAADLAARRAAFLAQTVTLLDSALEPEATLISLARLAVPSLADCAIVDLVTEEGNIQRVDVVEIDPTRRESTQTVRRIPPELRGDGPFARAIRTGQPALLTNVSENARAITTRPDSEYQRLIHAVSCEALLLIPLVARGQTLGLLTLGSRTHDRYGAADLSLAQELAARAAVALDNGRLYREAQAASRAKDEFLATVSHELRTPINAVLGWTAMLRNDHLDPSRADYACEAIERSARAQAQLLEQLLDVSRIVSGKLELRLAPVHIEAIIGAALDAVRPAADDKNVRILTEIEHGMPLLLADPERLQQVVVNVLSNAVKFSPDEGVVDVALHRDEGFARIVVRDHGVGIKSEFLPYVFDRFRQEASAGNRGLGLGLWIVRDIVERHGGTVNAESEGEGKGSTFTVTLPLRAQAEPAPGTLRMPVSKSA
jgi:signal transduction histidine kinase